jgi:SAM-dependent methyltransferase
MKRVIARELMDDPLDSPAELEANLGDIEFANRVFGGSAPVIRAVRHYAARSVLDVCCGSGDIARALALDARRRGAALTLTVLDRSDQMLEIARRRTSDAASITFAAGDATALPYGDASFDVVTCNLALHHFDPAAAHALLRELRRVARVAPLVCDLRRSPLAYAAALGWSRIGSRNRLTRHDAPLSVRRAYTPHEAHGLALAAGWPAPRVRREAFFRMTLVDESSLGSAGCGS